MKQVLIIFLLVLLFLPLGSSVAQTTTGALRGQVTDPSGAAITGATVVMTPATGSPVTAQTNAQGIYEFKTLSAGKYSLTVVAQGFTVYENDNVAVVADQPLQAQRVHDHPEVETLQETAVFLTPPRPSM